MATMDLLVNVDGQSVARSLEEAAEKLVAGEGDAVLDFSSVRRLDPRALRAIEEFAGIAEGKSIKITLRGVSVDVYKTLKLMKLTGRFSFVH